MIRLGIGFGLIVTAGIAFWVWLERHDAETYSRAQVEITRKLQQDAALKERQAIEAEDAVTPTPSDPAALAALCAADLDCRDGRASK